MPSRSSEWYLFMLIAMVACAPAPVARADSDGDAEQRSVVSSPSSEGSSVGGGATPVLSSEPAIFNAGPLLQLEDAVGLLATDLELETSATELSLDFSELYASAASAHQASLNTASLIANAVVAHPPISNTGSLLLPAVLAHQPVMDMAPRWKDGWGFQVRNVYRYSDELLNGDSKVSNPFGRDRRVNTTWLEGIYTFKREVRATVKIPWVNQSRTVLHGGVPVKQTADGLGDSIVALLLKSYTNEPERTFNTAWTPQIRIPTGETSGDFPAGDGSVDFGLSASASFETAGLYQFYDVFYWHNTQGVKGIDQGDELGFDMNIGLHPYHDNETNSGIFVMVDVTARYQDRGRDTEGITGGTRLAAGPMFVYYRNNLMIRVEYSFDLYEKVNGTQVSHGDQITIGVGITF